MSKISTKIKGTTFYKIDFGRLKQGDKLTLVRDPQNIHDSNAIKVLHNDAMLGHIDKQVASVLAGMIDNGVKVKAFLSKILGGPSQNYGLLIDLSIYEHREPGYYNRNNDSYHVNTSNFHIKETSFNHDVSYKSIAYDKRMYYKQKYNLDDEIIVGEKPDFYAIYKSTHGVFSRIFGDGANRFVNDQTVSWNKKVEQANAHNANLKSKISEYDNIFDENDFILFKKRYFIAQIVNKLNITVKDNKTIEDDITKGYVTTYELLLYEKLLGKVWMYRQVVILGYSLDFLLFNLETNKIWAVEVDGGIHKLLHKFNRDKECEEELGRLGVSLIRVSNSLIGKNVESVVDNILKTVYKTQ
jgi:very-short-patch-repair endonuclease